jgi:Peptidase family S41
LSKIWGEIKNTKGLIIDDRNYPSDFIIYELSNYLLPDSIPFVKFSNGSVEHPGLFTFTKALNAGKNNKDYYKGKVVVLLNEISQSSAEFHAMAYRVHPNVTVIGSTTAGADGNVSQISLPGGIRTGISGIGVYYPDGKETQRIGIVPDIEVKPTIAGIKSGRDELLEKAIEIINKQ